MSDIDKTRVEVFSIRDRIEAGKPGPLKALNIEEFLSREFPPRINLLEPWLPLQGLVQVYAYRGVGKTYFAIGVAVAVASGGSYLGWQAPDPKRVLYIDGEMTGGMIQERLAAANKANGKEYNPDNLMIINPDLQKNGMPDLASFEGQEAIKDYCEQAELIIVDNVSTLCRSGAENKADDWTIVQDWALRMRAAGRSVLFVHHSGKGGQQRGTSKREDVLDTVIKLSNPSDYTPENGCEFEVHFEKTRGITGEDVSPLIARLEGINGTLNWSFAPLELRTYDRVVELHREGFSQADIAREIDCNRSTVSRHVRRAKNDGDI